MLLIYFFRLKRISVSAWLLCLLLCGMACRQPPPPAASTFHADSLQVEALLNTGDSLYAIRSGLSTIENSLLYFDSAHRMAQRLGDTALLAQTLYYIGNVYNAWNKEPQTTVDYYQQAAALFQALPRKKIKATYVHYIIAHAYDREKMNDSLRCIQTVQAALQDLVELPDTLLRQMNFLSDFAWVSTNAGNYTLAAAILDKLVPRSCITNDPESNNYLDHYYIARSRIGILGQHQQQSPYLDSLEIALRQCNNRFDSGYYTHTLAQLYAAAGNYKQAYRFLSVNTGIGSLMENTNILSGLQKELLNRELVAEKERAGRVEKELENKKLYLFISLLVMLVLVMGTGLFLVYQKQVSIKKEARSQQQFTQLLLNKEEEERKRIATDLHDGVNHDLLALKNRLLLGQVVEPADIESITNSIRFVTRNLFPALFESVGMPGSIQALCDRMTNAGVFTTCEIDYDNSLSKREELQLYRIIQEALTNIYKHAAAEAAKITIRTSLQEMSMEIKDSGKGFDQKAKQQDFSTFGLQSMQQRAQALGAQLFIESSPKGTRILISKVV